MNRSRMQDLMEDYDYFKDRKDRNGKGSEKKWIRCKEAVCRYGVSRTTIIGWACECGALIKINGVNLIDCEKLDLFVESYRV